MPCTLASAWFSAKSSGPYCVCSSWSKQSPPKPIPILFFPPPPKRLPVPNCLLSFISRGMLGKRVAGFQTLPSHKLTTIALAESANLLSASAVISPESPSLDTLTRIELTKKQLWKGQIGKRLRPRPSEKGTRAPARPHMHACSPALWLVRTEADRIGSRLRSYLVTNRLTCSLTNNDGAEHCAPCAPALPQHPCAHPWPLRRRLILPLSAAVRISSPDNTISTTVDLNVFSTNFPRHWA